MGHPVVRQRQYRLRPVRGRLRPGTLEGTGQKWEKPRTRPLPRLLMGGDLQTPTMVAGRSCGDCSLCCKLMQVDEFDKPQGVWCRHCAPGHGGCTIHATRPAICREFFCGWLVGANLGPEWRPLTSRMILFFEKNTDRLAVHVDPEHAGVWRREPYYRQLKGWSREATAIGRQIVVYIRRKAIVILPDTDVDLGDLQPGDHIRVGMQATPRGRVLNAIRIPVNEVAPEHAGKWIAPHGLAEALNRAVSAYRAGKLVEAEQLCGQVVAAQPDFFDALHLLALVQSLLGNKETALAGYDRALALVPDHAEAHSNRGLTLHGLGRFEEALASYDRALGLLPSYAEALTNRGRTLHELGRFEEALASYDRAIVVRPLHVGMHNGRGVTLHELKRFEEALASYDRALALRPGYAEALHNRGVSLRELMRVQQGRSRAMTER